MTAPFTENRAFEEMRRVAVSRLLGRDPETIARLSGVERADSGKLLNVRSLQESVCVRLPAWELEPSLEPWRHLVLLHYLDRADGAPLAGEWIPFGALKDGMIRGARFERTVDEVLGGKLGACPLPALEAACRSLGAEIQPSTADLCAVFPFFPRYPVKLQLWLADEEFDGSARLLLDGSSDHYLAVEDAVTVGEVLMQKLEHALSAV